jgi:tetratricopeptide (TPR) repeat protein
MNETLPEIYLIVLLVLLAGLAVFVIREIIKTRKTESKLSRLQKKLKQEKGTAYEYYELGSIYTQKKLFSQAINLFQRALKAEDEIESENLALIYNALGYAYFAQEQYDLAIRNYKEAVKHNPEYSTALNNLAYAYERKQLVAKALETYEETLKHDPDNDTAKRRATSLRKQVVG